MWNILFRYTYSLTHSSTHALTHSHIQGNEHLNETPKNSAGTSFLGLVYFCIGLMLLLFISYVILVNHYLWHDSHNFRNDTEKLIKFPSVNAVYASTDNATRGTTFKQVIKIKDNRLFYTGMFIFYLNFCF